MSRAACHTTGGREATVRRPWADDPRADAKDALLKYAVEKPEGVRLSHVARMVLDPSAENGDRDDKLARRFYTEEYAHLFKTDRRDGFLWVEPRDVALLLKSSRRASADGAGEGVESVEFDVSRASGSLPSRAPSGRAAVVARSVLRDRCEITPGPRGARVRAALCHALAAHREGVDTVGMRPDRVSSVGRVAARQGEYVSAFEAATAAGYRRGTLLTLTARPGESGDMVDTAVAVNESVDPLRDHLRRQTPGDGRPSAVVIREVTERGVLHLHVVVFGVGPGEFDRDALSRYWHRTRGHGYVVDRAPVECRVTRRGRRWVFGDHADAETARGRYVRAYLGGTLFRFREVAASSPAELHAGADQGGRGWWKVALLWACGLPLVSVSERLREVSGTDTPREGSGGVSGRESGVESAGAEGSSEGDDELPHVPRSRSRSRRKPPPGEIAGSTVAGTP